MRGINSTWGKNSGDPLTKPFEQSLQSLCFFLKKKKKEKKISSAVCKWQETYPHLPAPDHNIFAWCIKRHHDGFIHKWWGFHLCALGVQGACPVRRGTKYLEFMGSNIRRKWRRGIRGIVILYANPFSGDFKYQFRTTDGWERFLFLWIYGRWRCSCDPLCVLVRVSMRHENGFTAQCRPLHNLQLMPSE